MKLISNSDIRVFQTCKMKYKYMHKDNLTPIKTSNALSIGSAFHAGVYALYATHLISDAVHASWLYLQEQDKTYWHKEEYEQLQEQLTLVEVMLKAFYEVIYVPELKKGIVTVEQEEQHIVPMKLNNHKSIYGWKYCFTMDRLYRDEFGKLWLREYKTTSRVSADMYKKVQIDSQILGMIYFLQKQYQEQINVDYLVVKKTSLRQKKTESKEEYQGRVLQEYIDNPKESFIREEVIIDQRLVTQWAEDTFNVVKEMKYVISNNLWSKNSSACIVFNTCEYINLCRKCEFAEQSFKERSDRYIESIETGV